jgi:hypothetical protein
MAEAQVAQANHQTHGVNPTWTKHLQAAGDGVVAVQLCCPDVVPVAPLALNETA